MENINELKKQQSAIHPGFGSYLECMTRALFTGLAAFTLAFSSTFIGQSLMKKHLPYGRNNYILVSGCLAAAVSYQVTTQRTKSCQAAWMAVEDKHTYLKQTEKSTHS
ncbi:transmembrane protein 141 [Periplaneta americana]|uniref:transmembrane protein 141 n=1 Tax=Periplaneta americana TaxID=6978 RepID=UPI0037E96ED0